MRIRGSVVAILVIFVAAVTTAGQEISQLVIDPPPGRIYMDDVVFVQIARGHRAGLSTDLKIESSGFTVFRDGWGLELELTPAREGLASLGPIHFIDSRGRIAETIPRVSFQVESPLDDIFSGPEDALSGLKRRQRRPVTIRANESWIRTYPGLAVTVAWDAVYAPEPTGFSLRVGEPPNVENVKIKASEAPPFDSSAGDLGIEVSRQELARWTLVASAPGRYAIDPGWARGSSSGLSGGRRPFRRKMPEILLEALAPPEGVSPDTPIGDFTLSCPTYAVRADSGAVVVALEVKGSGIIRDGFKVAGVRAKPIVFHILPYGGPDLKVPAEAYKGKANIVFLSTSTFDWEVAVPEINYNYWSPSTRSMQSARCKATTLAMQGRPNESGGGAGKLAVRPSSVFTTLELATLAFVVASAFVVIRAMRS